MSPILGTAAVRGTMLMATVVWAWAEVLKIRRPRQVEPARRLWTISLALALLHAVIAFEVAYQWSHGTVYRGTARKTAAVTGIVWGGGIFVNYLFLAVWLADAIWWWIAPVGYIHRSVRVERTRLALFVFMFAQRRDPLCEPCRTRGGRPLGGRGVHRLGPSHAEAPGPWVARWTA